MIRANISRGTGAHTIILALVLIPTLTGGKILANDGLYLRGTNSARDGHGSFGLSIAGGAGHMSPKNQDGDKIFLFEDEPQVLKVYEDGPADGILRTGDWIVAIDGLSITSEDAAWMFLHPLIDRTYELTIRRDEREQTVEITGGEPDVGRADDHTIEVITHDPEGNMRLVSYTLNDNNTITQMSASESSGGDSHTRSWIGLGLESDTIEVTRAGEHIDYIYFNDSPKVYSVDPDSPADRAGIQRGDVIVKVDGKRLDEDEGGERWSIIEPGDDVELLVLRDDRIKVIELEAEEHPARTFEHLDHRYVLIHDPQDDEGHLRYAGTIGEVDVEVRGLSDVSVSKSGDKLCIRTGDTTVWLSIRDK